MTRILSVLFCSIAVSASGQGLEEAAANTHSTLESKAAEVTVIDSVTRRGVGGRVETFTDARHRTYSVGYDDASRVASIRKRADRVYIDDLLDVAYADDGRLVSVMFGDGNLWVFSYGEGGVQFVQDRYGATITRKVGANGRPLVIEKVDPKDTLSNNLEKLDALLTELNGPRQAQFPGASVDVACLFVTEQRCQKISGRPSR